MTIRNSFLAVIRTKWKSMLFSALIGALALFLYLGLNLWRTATEMLDSSESMFTTVAVLEYTGPGYPDSPEDPAIAAAKEKLDETVLSGNKNVIVWEPSVKMAGIIKGYANNGVPIPFDNEGILIISKSYFMENLNIYNSLSPAQLYYTKESSNIKMLIDASLNDIKLEYKNDYLATGRFYHGATAFPYFLIESPPANLLEKLGINPADIPELVDITGKREEFLADETSPYHRLAEYYKTGRLTIPVIAVGNMESCLDFNQERVRVIEGEGFGGEKYGNGAKVCLISKTLANLLGVSIGDSIPLNYGRDAVDLTLTGGKTEEYEIIGLLEAQQDVFKNVYIPGTAADYPGMTIDGYTLGTVTLANGSVDQFLADVEPYLPENLTFTVYDQGYAAVMSAMIAIRRTALLLTCVCALLTLCVIGLFGYLTVYKQRDTVDVMAQLGTEKRSIFAYLLFGAGTIAAVASMVGVYIGGIAADEVAKKAFDAAAQLYSMDIRYSTASLGIVKEMGEIASVPPGSLPYIAVAGVFLTAMLMCFAFAWRAVTAREPKKRKRTSVLGPKKAGKSSGLGGGALKYALLAIRRGGARTAVVPIICAAVTLFCAALAGARVSYEGQLVSLYNDTTVYGRITDTSGRRVGGIGASPRSLSALYEIGVFNDMYMTTTQKYIYMGISVDAEGNEYEMPEIVQPGTPEATETAMARYSRSDDIIFTNEIDFAPEFVYSTGAMYSFAPEWDADTFWDLKFDENTEYVIPCLIPEVFAEKNGISPGDTIRVTYVYSNGSYIWLYPLDLKIAGIFTPNSSKSNIYAPLPFFFDTELIKDPEGTRQRIYDEHYQVDQYYEYQNPYTGRTESHYNPDGWTYTGLMNLHEANMAAGSIQSFAFMIDDVNDLTPFKDALEKAGYSPVNRLRAIRTTILIDDRQFMESAGMLTRNLAYINALEPLLYALSAALSIAVSFLLMLGRRGELAVMRSMGAGYIRAFLSFFFEQALLCALGFAAAIGAWAAFAGVSAEVLSMASVSQGLYLAGGALAVIIMNRKNVLDILAVKE